MCVIQICHKRDVLGVFGQLKEVVRTMDMGQGLRSYATMQNA